MAYSFKISDDSLTAAVRRVALDQIDTALAEAAEAEISEAERIHQLRKRCKKLRGLIRLVRPGFADYSRENAMFRSTAHGLADVRDARALVETCDALKAQFDNQLYANAFSSIRNHFEKRAQEVESAPDLGERLEEAADAFRDARERACTWTVDPNGAKSIAGGVQKTYGRGCTAMKAARKTPTGENLHEWRKRAKYHWYHLRLLKHTSPVAKAEVGPAEELADLLGDHHDIHVMGEALEAAGEIADADALTAFRGLMRARQDMLEAEAFRLGRAVFVEPPKVAADRLATYWTVWRKAAGS
ncbi:CHAD domain-containing protein [Palleronia sp.]|uniref:CHAD domain-containing protein n=1 Tax=Palleronia sp. TaxID=1940284 RepID=UPI0035C80E23